MEVLLVRGIRHFPYPGIHLYSLFCLRAGKIPTRKKTEPCPALSGGSDINQIVGKVLVHMHVLTHTHTHRVRIFCLSIILHISLSFKNNSFGFITISDLTSTSYSLSIVISVTILLFVLFTTVFGLISLFYIKLGVKCTQQVSIVKILFFKNFSLQFLL